MADTNHTASGAKSKTDQAIAYMTEHKVSVYAAAKACHVDPASVYKRLDKMRALQGLACPCCGQIVPKPT